MSKPTNINLHQKSRVLEIEYEDEDYEASVLFASVLGGGANSKLFNEIREEKSLSYYIYAKLDKFKSIMLIASGINTTNCPPQSRI